jgi:uncharacterized protein (DUF433 family)
LVVEQQAYGWSPEELHFQHPYLTSGQIHSAPACYWDHREEPERMVLMRARFAGASMVEISIIDPLPRNCQDVARVK